MIWQHVKAVILLPFTVPIVIPAIILCFTDVGGMAWQQAEWLVGPRCRLSHPGLAAIVPLGHGGQARRLNESYASTLRNTHSRLRSFSSK